MPFGSAVSEGGGVDGLVGRGPVSLLLLLVLLVVVVEEGGVSVVEPMTAHARRLLVLVEVAAQRERLGTVRTAEWLLAGVRDRCDPARF